VGSGGGGAATSFELATASPADADMTCDAIATTAKAISFFIVKYVYFVSSMTSGRVNWFQIFFCKVASHKNFERNRSIRCRALELEGGQKANVIFE
jgi:hypothetical protein